MLLCLFFWQLKVSMIDFFSPLTLTMATVSKCQLGKKSPKLREDLCSLVTKIAISGDIPLTRVNVDGATLQKWKKKEKSQKVFFKYFFPYFLKQKFAKCNCRRFLPTVCKSLFCKLFSICQPQTNAHLSESHVKKENVYVDRFFNRVSYKINIYDNNFFCTPSKQILLAKSCKSVGFFFSSWLESK